jgi:hypothetical protein
LIKFDIGAPHNVSCVRRSSVGCGGPVPDLLHFGGWVVSVSVSVSVGAAGALFSSVSVPDLPEPDDAKAE